MIGKLKGIVDDIFNDHLIIDVNGVGYKIFCSGKTLNKFSTNDSISLLIETYVREDNIQLFGFAKAVEKQFFLLLITVKGIGTKVALGILSVLNPEQLCNVIIANDKTIYKNLPGVGLKTWERIIIELKDKVLSKDFKDKDYHLSSMNDKEQSMHNSIVTDANTLNEMSSDAVSALVNLGINKIEAYSAINDILKNEPNISLNQLITSSLKLFAKNK